MWYQNDIVILIFFVHLSPNFNAETPLNNHVSNLPPKISNSVEKAAGVQVQVMTQIKLFVSVQEWSPVTSQVFADRLLPE